MEGEIDKVKLSNWEKARRAVLSAAGEGWRTSLLLARVELVMWIVVLTPGDD